MNSRRCTAFLDEAAPHPLRRDEESVDTRIEPHSMHAVVRKNRGEKEIFLAALLKTRRRTLGKRMRADHRVRCMEAHEAAHVALRQRSDELLHGRSALPVPREAIEKLVKIRHEVQHLQIGRLHEPSDPRRITLREVDDRHMRLRLRPQKTILLCHTLYFSTSKEQIQRNRRSLSPSSSSRKTAVYAPRRARHEGSGIGGQKKNNIGDFFRPRDTTERIDA